MSPLSPVQVEHLLIAYQLLSEAQVPPPAAALVGHLNPAGFAPHLQDEITEFYIGHHGLDENTARQSAEASVVHKAVVSIPLSADVLRLLLNGGVVLDGDEGLIVIDSGSALPVTFARSMSLRVTLSNLGNITLAPADAVLSDYLTD